jgi:hypothetical protein
LERVPVEERAVVGDPTIRSVQIAIPVLDKDAGPCGAFIDVVGNEMEKEARAFGSVRALFARDVIVGADLIKRHIEGMEYSVLSAVQDYIEAAKPTIFVEVLDEASRLKEFLESLCARAGYSAYAITTDGLNNIPHIGSVKLQRNYRIRDVLFSANRIPDGA